jgi:hypothetical protein
MERDKSHEEQLIRWAKFIRENPEKWQEEHTLFINSQIELAEEFYQRLAKTEDGRRILLKLKENKLSANN